MRKDEYIHIVDDLKKRVETFIAELDDKSKLDKHKLNLLDEIELKAKSAVFECEIMRFSIYKASSKFGDCFIKGWHEEENKLLGKLFVKEEEYRNIETCVYFARAKMEQGEDLLAMHLATSAGYCYPGNSKGDLSDLRKILSNLSKGRKLGVETRQVHASQKKADAKRMIDALFAYHAHQNQFSKGWNMSKKEIYEFLRARGIGWADKHAERMLGAYIDEVKAKQAQK